MAKLIGLFTLGRDAEVRETSGGDPVANLSLAYNYGRKGADGKRPTQWVEASLWGERAEKLEEYLTKGSQFLFELDDLHIETFERREGGQGHKLVARVVDLEFTRGGSQDRAPAPAPAPANRRAPAPAPRPSSGFDDMDDDIPF
ncbi:MAG: single-stranded DNA-binding protein [Burkholderiales bacterium]|nr:single-stranded DNA-binding protein [Burkholderiales bacterium]